MSVASPCLDTPGTTTDPNNNTDLSRPKHNQAGFYTGSPRFLSMPPPGPEPQKQLTQCAGMVRDCIGQAKDCHAEEQWAGQSNEEEKQVSSMHEPDGYNLFGVAAE
ncbi:UNVERIFIED_CONTAM: hypothetical protein K2H54_023661 [Gekko kuhli]